MKKFLKQFSLTLPLLLLLQTSLFAQIDNYYDATKDKKEKKYEFVKTKAVNKSYTVSSSDKLNIDNSFGKVEVTTWDKNEVKVDVSIEVSSNTEVYAQKLIDRISVSENQSDKEISIKTNIKGMNNTGNEKSTMSINYSISMPSNNPLKVKNEFGSTTIPDFKGEVDLTSKFGSLTTGTLTNIKNIHVEFGKATLANIINTPVTIKFSKAVISKVSGAVKLNFEFCDNVRVNLDNSLTSLDLKTSYSTINLKPLGDLPASYNISTSFGSFKNTSSIKFSSDEDDGDNRGPKFDYEYSGKSGSGSIPVKVKSSFGKIIVGEASEEDMKSKDKNKSKPKTRTS
jgi:hypothetical protein